MDSTTKLANQATKQSAASNLDLSAVKVIPEKLLKQGFARLSDHLIDRNYLVFQKNTDFGTVDINLNTNFASFVLKPVSECTKAVKPHEILTDSFNISIDHTNNDIYIRITVMGTVEENVILSMWLSTGLISSPHLYSITSDQDTSHVDFNCTLGSLYDTHNFNQ